MERKIGEIFECNGIKLRVEEERCGCKGCYFQHKKGWCISLKEIIGECMDSMRNDTGVIFIKIDDMEERTIKLTLEKAKEFYRKGDEFKDLALSAFTKEELEKVELPKTWEEFCKLYDIHFPNEYYIDSSSNIRKFLGGLGRDVNSCKNVLPTRETAEAHLALMQLHQLRDCYRQGWKPDWENTDLCKYSIVLVNNTPKILPSYSCNCFLSFQSKKIAEEFLNNFRDLIIKAGDLI